MLTGLCGLCVGTYAVLDQTAPRILALPMLGLGVLTALLGLLGAGGRVRASRYRPDPWLAAEWVVLAAGVTTATIGVLTAHRDVALAYPALTTWPQLGAAHLAAAAVALAGGMLSPPPAVHEEPAAADVVPVGAS